MVLAGGGLVEHEHLRAHREDRGDPNQLAQREAQAVGVHLGVLLNVEEDERLINPTRHLIGRQPQICWTEG